MSLCDRVYLRRGVTLTLTRLLGVRLLVVRLLKVRLLEIRLRLLGCLRRLRLLCDRLGIFYSIYS